MDFGVLIPAYNPTADIIVLVKDLIKEGISRIVIVNDGSEAHLLDFFNELAFHPQVKILNHATNLGKGAALKTGFNYIFTTHPEITSVVTADADGQHCLEDIIKIGRKVINEPGKLILGVRTFNRDVPWRSKIGNRLTKYLYRAIVGQKISDTQTGLRGISRDFIPDLLKIPSNSYEFELDMLIACKYTQRKVVENEIATIYIDNNQSSHFNPIIDSLKIYFVLFRSILLSFATFLVDISVFSLASAFGGSLLTSQALARGLSIVFYYPLAKKAVFFSDAENKIALPKYIFLVIMSGLVSYGVMSFLIYEFHLSFLSAKILAESVIYICNFAIQREFIFVSKKYY